MVTMHEMKNKVPLAKWGFKTQRAQGNGVGKVVGHVRVQAFKAAERDFPRCP